MSIIHDLKQRKIFQWAVAYLAGAWVLMQLIDVLGSRWGVSDSTARIIDIILISGFFVTMVLAWYHGDKGHQRLTGPELLILASLMIVAGLAITLLNNEPTTSPLPASSVQKPVITEERPWIAVLPLKVQADDPELTSFADGLIEDISNGLSDFSYLSVLSRNTTAGYSADSANILQIEKELGARYVLQGALRKAGETTRITVQLVDARTGTQIWAETFDRELTGASVLDTQDELTDRIVATVADPAGVVVHALAKPTDGKQPEEMTAYEAVLRYFLFQQRVTEEDHFITRAALERAVEIEPRYADAWANLSLIYQQEFMNNLNPRPDPLERAVAAAQRAGSLDPMSARAEWAMAQARYFQKDIPAFRVHAERAIELNPRNTDTIAMVGILMGYGDDWERGVELTTYAMKLNPHHPGWYYFNTFFNEYRQHHFSEALAIAQKINLPGYWASALALTISNAQLGNKAAAERAAEDLLRIWPALEEEYYKMGMTNWVHDQPDFIYLVEDGLKKAGINLVTPEPTP